MTERIIIAGAGHAAGQVVASLKQHDFAGQIVLIGDEPYLPYQRPPLSKKFLSGDMPAERLYVKPASFYDDPQIQLNLETLVSDIDPDGKTIRSRSMMVDISDRKEAEIALLKLHNDVQNLVDKRTAELAEARKLNISNSKINLTTYLRAKIG